ncbi:hypothetical protein Vafri_17189, partial [Volvox africanus]
TLTVLRYILPPPAFADLVHGSPWATRVHADVSVLTAVFVDPHATAGVAASTPVVQSPVSLMAAMHDAHVAFDGLCAMHGAVKMSTLGHEYTAVGGLDGSSDHLERLMRLAAGMVAALVEQQHAQIQAGVAPLEVQIGLHTGIDHMILLSPPPPCPPSPPLPSPSPLVPPLLNTHLPFAAFERTS